MTASGLSIYKRECYPFKAKFHYGILVADRSEAGRRPVADLLARAGSLLVIGQIPARCRSATRLGLVCDQDNAMEFGSNKTIDDYSNSANCAAPFAAPWQRRRRPKRRFTGDGGRRRVNCSAKRRDAIKRNSRSPFRPVAHIRAPG